MMQTRTALAAAALLALGAAASSPAFAADKDKLPADAAQRSCFYTRNVDGFAAPDDKTVYVRVGVRDVYRFDMFGPCPDLDWNQRLALVSRGSSWICSGMDAEVITHSPIGPQRCPVRSVRKLTPVEVAALPKKSRP
jgi:hypothetical protein